MTSAQHTAEAAAATTGARDSDSNRNYCSSRSHSRSNTIINNREVENAANSNHSNSSSSPLANHQSPTQKIGLQLLNKDVSMGLKSYNNSNTSPFQLLEVSVLQAIVNFLNKAPHPHPHR